MSGNSNSPEQKELAEEFLLLRFLIGLMGMLLPLVLALGAIFSGCHVFQQAISLYYYTNMGNVFVGYIICLSVFLLAYPGYEKDHRYGKAAFVLGCTFAFLPTVDKGDCHQCHLPFCNPDCVSTIGIIHLCCAGAFIVVLGIYSFFLFTKTDKEKIAGKDYHKKKSRNKIYKWCGAIIFITVGILILLFALEKFTSIQIVKELLEQDYVVYAGEVISLEAFGIAWFVKGGALLRDINTPGPVHRLKLFVKTGRVRKEELWELYNKKRKNG